MVYLWFPWLPWQIQSHVELHDTREAHDLQPSQGRHLRWPVLLPQLFSRFTITIATPTKLRPKLVKSHSLFYILMFITFDLFGGFYRLTVGLMVITTIVDGVYKPTSITGGYHLLWWNFEKLVMPIRATRGCWNHGTCAVVYNYMWVFADISFTVPQDIIDCHSTWSYLRRYVRVSVGC